MRAADKEQFQRTMFTRHRRVHLWSCIPKDACRVQEGVCQHCRVIGIAINVVKVIQNCVTTGLQINAKLCCELPLALCHLTVYRQQQAMPRIHILGQRCAVNGAAKVCEAETQSCYLSLGKGSCTCVGVSIAL